MAKLTNLLRDVDDCVIDFIQPERKRIILVANNHLIRADIIDKFAFSEDDTIVQFNLCPHFETFRGIQCHKVHVFNYGEGKWWGFSSGGEPSHDYIAQHSSTLILLFKSHLSPGARLFIEKNSSFLKGGIINLNDFPFQPYPDSKGPSIGFATVCYFRYINILRFLMKQPPLKILILGFSGSYPPGKAWDGHDFKFEQKVYNIWLDLVHLDHSGALTEMSK